MSKETPTNVLVLPDIHYRAKPGGEDKRALNALKQYASDHEWSHVIFLGDVMDHNSISSHSKGLLKSVEGETLLKDYNVANKDLDQIEQATQGAKKVVLEGNHDYRATVLADVQPQLSGLVEMEYGLQLSQRNWVYVPYWSTGKTYSLGKATFGHGRYTSKHHAYTHASKYGRNFYYGHLHDFQSYTMEREGDDLKYEAASLGCLCSYRQYWLKGRPTKWQQGFGVFRFQPNGNFNRYDVRIFNHRFISPEGKEYKG